MNEKELERFEVELRQLPPAPVSPEILARMRTAKPELTPVRSRPAPRAAGGSIAQLLLRWLVPAVATVFMVLLMRGNMPRPMAAKPSVAAAIPAGLKADDVQVDQELVSSFDVVATLPGGEPVRFRCREMKDEWVVTDRRLGVEITESQPRLEVTPVRFETY